MTSAMSGREGRVVMMRFVNTRVHDQIPPKPFQHILFVYLFFFWLEYCNFNLKKNTSSAYSVHNRK